MYIHLCVTFFKKSIFKELIEKKAHRQKKETPAEFFTKHLWTANSERFKKISKKKIVAK